MGFWQILEGDGVTEGVVVDVMEDVTALDDVGVTEVVIALVRVGVTDAVAALEDVGVTEVVIALVRVGVTEVVGALE